MGSSSPSYMGIWGVWWCAIVKDFCLGWETGEYLIELLQLVASTQINKSSSNYISLLHRLVDGMCSSSDISVLKGDASMRSWNSMSILFDPNSWVITIQFCWSVLGIISLVVISPYSSSRLHIETWQGQMFKSLSRICCTQELWIVGGEARTNASIDPFSLLGFSRTEMCRAPNPASTNKGSQTKNRSNEASPFSSTGRLLVNLGRSFGKSIVLFGTPSPFISFGWSGLDTNESFECPVSLTSFICFLMYRACNFSKILEFL